MNIKSLQLLMAMTVVSAVLLTSCSKEDKNQQVEFTRFSISEFCEGAELMDDSKDHGTLVITSKQDFTKEAGCLTSLPEVNFDTHFVIARKVTVKGCADNKKESIVSDGDKLTYVIELEIGDCTQMETFYSMAVVPAKYKGYKVDAVNRLYQNGSLSIKARVGQDSLEFKKEISL